MSRPRTRPTREETRDALLRAAARVFSDKGIGSASIEDICDEAGYSRGAFYSSFGTKNDLVIALLEVHETSSSEEIERLWTESANPADFIANMESERRIRTSPLEVEDGGILYVELLLYALRSATDDTERLLAQHRRLRESNESILQRIVAATGRNYPLPIDDVVTMIMAIDVGLNLNQLVDPDSHRPGQFSDIMGFLHQLWLAAPPDAFDQ